MSFESKHFQESEFACKCGCGFANPKPELVAALDLLRDLADCPIKIDDACRCTAHNAEVGGVPHSQHPLGEAADIVFLCDPRLTNQQMYDLAKQVPAFQFGGIGLYASGTFIHVDTRQGKARWFRDAHGAYVPFADSGVTE